MRSNNCKNTLFYKKMTFFLRFYFSQFIFEIGSKTVKLQKFTEKKFTRKRAKQFITYPYNHLFYRKKLYIFYGIFLSMQLTENFLFFTESFLQITNPFSSWCFCFKIHMFNSSHALVDVHHHLYHLCGMRLLWSRSYMEVCFQIPRTLLIYKNLPSPESQSRTFSMQLIGNRWSSWTVSSPNPRNTQPQHWWDQSSHKKSLIFFHFS